eukprot:TRINITY_DN11305_c0_g1_i1.p1 TRINITY_DN11305_c0_g1~~TRINITY_DN11305_c0_g1_i1.p1  ORF type:complete len:566 (+),score=112.14 TRINITY_DN11305_c0_g1_i1:75-1700(+)
MPPAGPRSAPGGGGWAAARWAWTDRPAAGPPHSGRPSGAAAAASPPPSAGLYASGRTRAQKRMEDDSRAAELEDAFGSRTDLRLRHRNISDRQCTALGRALQCGDSRLRVLDLSHNPLIGDEGARALADGLAVDSSLQCLDLSATSVGDLGVCAIAAALEGNTSLRSLALLDCPAVGKLSVQVVESLVRSGAGALARVALPLLAAPDKRTAALAASLAALLRERRALQRARRPRATGEAWTSFEWPPDVRYRGVSVGCRVAVTAPVADCRRWHEEAGVRWTKRKEAALQSGVPLLGVVAAERERALLLLHTDAAHRWWPRKAVRPVPSGGCGEPDSSWDPPWQTAAGRLRDMPRKLAPSVPPPHCCAVVNAVAPPQPPAARPRQGAGSLGHSAILDLPWPPEDRSAGPPRSVSGRRLRPARRAHAAGPARRLEGPAGGRAPPTDARRPVPRPSSPAAAPGSPEPHSSRSSSRSSSSGGTGSGPALEAPAASPAAASPRRRSSSGRSSGSRGGSSRSAERSRSRSAGSRGSSHCLDQTARSG